MGTPPFGEIGGGQRIEHDHLGKSIDLPRPAAHPSREGVEAELTVGAGDEHKTVPVRIGQGLHQILDTAQSFFGVNQREMKKVPLLRGKSVFNLFFEPSTRTRTTFEIAAKRLSADVVNLAINVSYTYGLRDVGP